jgi:hypothetical protein
MSRSAMLRERGNWFLTMKWSDRIAQGFSPGYDVARRALKVATEVGVSVIRSSIRRPSPNGRVPLSGHVVSDPTQGRKPWAILSDHFMVKTAPDATNDLDTTT